LLVRKSRSALKRSLRNNEDNGWLKAYCAP
jgi:hypothetical protein